MGNQKWNILNKEGKVVIDSKGNIQSKVEGNTLENKNFLVNRLGYVCEYYIKNDKLKIKGLSTEFILVREDGKSNVNDDLEIHIFDENDKLVNIEELENELDLVKSDEIYEMIIVDGEVVSKILNGWTAKYE